MNREELGVSHQGQTSHDETLIRITSVAPLERVVFLISSLDLFVEAIAEASLWLSLFF